VSVGFRRARPDDVEFLRDLVNDEDVRPFLSVRAAADREALLEEIERSEQAPESFGRFVIEVDGEPAGSMGFHLANERSRIARLEGLAVHPRFRGTHVAVEAARPFVRHLLTELGFHRLEMEVFAFNERAQAHVERVGWVREGVKRRAYLRDGEWESSVCYSLLAEDLGSDA
jgi:RimJ/RimL family protein N-acetyltransferase